MKEKLYNSKREERAGAYLVQLTDCPLYLGGKSIQQGSCVISLMGLVVTNVNHTICLRAVCDFMVNV